MSARPPLIECVDLGLTFAGSSRVVALDNVSLTVERGAFVSLVGPSGCGKTTLLKLMAGLIAPTHGRLTFVSDPGHDAPRTALIFQEGGLFPWMTVVDNVAFALEGRGVPQRQRREQAKAAIARVGLQAFGANYPHELSVGMRQRVALVRAVLADADVLLMDEPLAALDYQSKRVLQGELLRLWEDTEKTVVYVTHDIREAVLLGDRVVVMSGRPGRILEQIDVPMPRPRGEEDHDDVRKLTRRIWPLLESEVRKSLALPG